MNLKSLTNFDLWVFLFLLEDVICGEVFDALNHVQGCVPYVLCVVLGHHWNAAGYHVTFSYCLHLNWLNSALPSPI